MVMTSPSLNAISCIFNLSCAKISVISESWANSGQDRYVLLEKLNSEIWFFLPDFDISSGQVQKWTPTSSSTSQVTHKIYVTRHSCNIFIRWPYLTWSWFLLSIRLILILLHPLRSLLVKFGIAAVISSVVVANNAKVKILHLI